MTEQTDSNLGKNLVDLLNKFGNALGEIFNDPELKAKAQEFGKSAGSSADAFASRFRDEDVKARWREVGKAAQEFGKSISEQFRSEKTQEPESGQGDSQPATGNN